MSCPQCSQTLSGSTCQSCGTYISVENGRVQPISKGRSIRVSDRNGFPRDLIINPSSIPSGDVAGTVESRDGSDSQPINLKFLRSVLAATGGVITIDADGNIGYLPKASTDGYLVTQAGVIKWTDVMPRQNVLNESELFPSRDKILTVSCANNGQLNIGFLDLDATDYIGVDSEGKPIGRTFCDATTDTELDYVFGCKGGVLTKIAPSEGLALFSSGGKWVAGAASFFEMITPQIIKSGDYLEQKGTVFDETINWASLTGYQSTARYALIRAWVFMQSNSVDYYGSLQLDDYEIATAEVREQPTLSGDSDTNSDQQWVRIPDNKQSTLKWIITELSGSTTGAGLNEHKFRVHLEGWAR